MLEKVCWSLNSRLGIGFEASEFGDVSGVRDTDQASPLRNMTLEAADTLLLVGVLLPTDRPNFEDICLPESSTVGRLDSNHCVSHA